MVGGTRLSEEDMMQIIEEAGSARRRIGTGNLPDSLRDMHSDLLECRRSLDRLDEVLGRVILAKGHASTLARAAKAAYEDAVMAVVNGPRARMRMPEYASAGERQAIIALTVVEQQREKRAAEAYEADLVTVYDYVRACHRGVDSARRDLETRIRVVSLESTLER